jgi:hypothetical protein
MKKLGNTQRWVLQWVRDEPNHASARSRREVLESLHKRGLTSIDARLYVRFWGRNKPFYRITPAGEQALAEDPLIAEYDQKVADTSAEAEATGLL